MKRSIFGFILLILIFTTYNPKNNLLKNQKINIKKIQISNIKISDVEKIKKDLIFYMKKISLHLKVKKLHKFLKRSLYRKF